MANRYVGLPIMIALAVAGGVFLPALETFGQSPPSTGGAIGCALPQASGRTHHEIRSGGVERAFLMIERLGANTDEIDATAVMMEFFRRMSSH
jgi:hypothetical protein